MPASPGTTAVPPSAAAGLATTLLREIDLGVRAATVLTTDVVATEIEVRVASRPGTDDLDWEAVLRAVPGGSSSAGIGGGPVAGEPTRCRAAVVAGGWPVVALAGVGRITAAKLSGRGIDTVLDLATSTTDTLDTTRVAALATRAARLVRWPVIDQPRDVTGRPLPGDLSLARILRDPSLRPTSAWWDVVGLADLVDDRHLADLVVDDLVTPSEP